MKIKFVPESDLVVRRSRTGLGLFAAAPIAKGARVIEYTGIPMDSDQQSKSRSRYLFEITDDLWIDGSPRSNRARYVNHACKPNCEIDIRKGRIFIFARRNIKPGEELNYDYGKEYTAAYFKESCLCRTCAPPPVRSTISKRASKATQKSAPKAPAKLLSKSKGARAQQVARARVREYA